MSADPAPLRPSLGANEVTEQPDSAARQRGPVIWFEVEDFLRYFDHFRTPTGLQRVPFEIYAEADRLYGRNGPIRFCRLSLYTGQFRAIDFDAVRAAYLNPLGASAPWTTIWAPANFWAEFSKMLPLVFRYPQFFLSLSTNAARDFADMTLRPRRFDRLVRRGDIIASLGAGWGIPDYMDCVMAACRRYGTRFALLVHDVIPIEHESFVERRHAVQFRKFLEAAMPAADVLLATSKYSRDALAKWAAETGRPPRRIEVVTPGSGLQDHVVAKKQCQISLPARYVLFVSTIEFRKNHRLLVRIWQRLIERHGADAVPSLVFAGQTGWLVDDLLSELQASRYLNGKIVVLPGLADAELRQAYRSCLFTVFPSLCEGWGLPIAESLTLGKFCVASNRPTMPEVAGDLIDYFDPENDDEALAKIERPLFDPAYLAAREARLRAEYRPRSWADCVQDLLGACGLRP